MNFNVLGTTYTLVVATPEEDKYLEKCDGYCDKTSKRVVVVSEKVDNELGDFKSYQKKCIRHEIIHAFLFESGLQENFKHDEWGHDETMIDWVAVQFPKLLKVFAEVNAL